MKTAIVEVPSTDYNFFEALMNQNTWYFKWTGEETPDYVEDEP